MKMILARSWPVRSWSPARSRRRTSRRPATGKGDKSAKKDDRRQEGRKKDDKKAGAGLVRPTPAAAGRTSAPRLGALTASAENASSAACSSRRKAGGPGGVRRRVDARPRRDRSRRSTSSSVRALPSLKYGAASHTPRSDGGLLPAFAQHRRADA